MGMTVRGLWDGLTNVLTGLGIAGKDPTTASQYNFTLLQRNDLENAYRSDWIARKIIDAPAEDATREWRDWQANQDQIDKIEAEENKHELQRKLRETLVRARLYGGAALVMGVAQGQPNEELDLDKVKEGDLKYVVVMNRYELNAGPRIYDVMSPWYTQPEYYTVATPTSGLNAKGPIKRLFSTKEMMAGGLATMAVQGMVMIHPSRVVAFSGNELPDWRLAPLGGGWGDSVLQTVDETIKDIGMITGGIANMVNDAKMDVINVPDFAKLMTNADYSQRLLARFATANAMKSNINSIMLDEKEKWQRVQSNFTGLPNMLHEFLSVVAGAADIPVSRLVGQSPGHGLGAGAGAGGSDIDLRNYYDRISAMQRTHYKPRMRMLDEVVIRSGTGARDDSIHYDWTPLWQLSEKEKADIFKTKSDAVQVVVNTALINEDAMRQAFANQLIEDGSLSGLEDAIDEHGIEPDIPESRMWSPQIDPNTGLPLAAPPGGGDPSGGQLALPAPDNLKDAAPRTLYVRRDVVNAGEIRRWAKSQGFEKLMAADELHVTVVYSKEALDWMKIGTPFFERNSDGTPKSTITIPEGGARLVEKMGNTVSLLFSSTELRWRHEDMLRAGATSDYDDYQPHIALTYDPGTLDWTKIEPYRGKIVLGPEIFEEINDTYRATLNEDGSVNPDSPYTAVARANTKPRRRRKKVKAGDQ